MQTGIYLCKCKIHRLFGNGAWGVGLIIDYGLLIIVYEKRLWFLILLIAESAVLGTPPRTPDGAYGESTEFFVDAVGNSGKKP